ncbi:hypothetical protein LguiB_009047 [Lonicera macranthoides]
MGISLLLTCFSWEMYRGKSQRADLVVSFYDGGWSASGRTCQYLGDIYMARPDVRSDSRRWHSGAKIRSETLAEINVIKGASEEGLKKGSKDYLPDDNRNTREAERTPALAKTDTPDFFCLVDKPVLLNKLSRFLVVTNCSLTENSLELQSHVLTGIIWIDAGHRRRKFYAKDDDNRKDSIHPGLPIELASFLTS